MRANHYIYAQYVIEFVLLYVHTTYTYIPTYSRIFIQCLLGKETGLPFIRPFVHIQYFIPNHAYIFFSASEVCIDFTCSANPIL